MTDTKRRLFIYDRKEVGVLILLGVGVALFAFTLGVHLGKQVVPKPVETAEEMKAVDPVQPAVQGAPNRQEISQEVKHVPGAVDETLDQSLRDEIQKTGLQVETSRQTELPEKVRKVPGHAVTPAKEESPAEKPPVKGASAPEVGAEESPKNLAKEKKPPSPFSAPKSDSPKAGRYTLQVGSFPSLREAEPELLKLNENGLRAEVREVDLTGKGKWFRLFVGQFDSVKDAEKAGKNFKQERRISEFVVVRAPNATRTE